MLTNVFLFRFIKFYLLSILILLIFAKSTYKRDNIL